MNSLARLWARFTIQLGAGGRTSTSRAEGIREPVAVDFTPEYGRLDVFACADSGCNKRFGFGLNRRRWAKKEMPPDVEELRPPRSLNKEVAGNPRTSRAQRPGGWNRVDAPKVWTHPDCVRYAEQPTPFWTEAPSYPSGTL